MLMLGDMDSGGASDSGGFFDSLSNFGGGLLSKVGGSLISSYMTNKSNKDLAKQSASDARKQAVQQALITAAQKKGQKKAEQFDAAKYQTPKHANQTRYIVYGASGLGALAIAGGAWYFFRKKHKKGTKK